MGNKQEELEVCVRSQDHDLTAVTETWWDSLHDCNAVMDGYRLFRKGRPARRGGGVALYVREQLECIELCLGVEGEQVESLWVKNKGQANMGDTVVGICYRPHDQEEVVVVDEAFYRQLEVASQSQALVLVGDFNLLGGIPWPRALEGRGAQESWSVFKDHFLRAQDWCIPRRKKSGRGARRPAKISKDKQRASRETQMEEGGSQYVEKRTGHLGGM